MSSSLAATQSSWLPVGESDDACPRRGRDRPRGAHSESASGYGARTAPETAIVVITDGTQTVTGGAASWRRSISISKWRPVRLGDSREDDKSAVSPSELPWTHRNPTGSQQAPVDSCPR